MERKALKLKDGRKATIRPLAKSDAELLCRCFRRYSAEARRNFAPHPFSRETAEKLCTCLPQDAASLRYIIAAGRGAQEKPFGYAILYQLDQKVPLLAIGLADEATGQGLGRQVAEFQIEVARRHGFAKVGLCVMMRNTRARMLYESMGFTYQGHRFWDDHGKGWSLRMEKNIRERKGNNVWQDDTA